MAFGAICIALALSAYILLYDLRIGFVLSGAATIAVIFRISALSRAARVVVRDPRAVSGVVASGVLWAAVIGAVSVACSLTNVIMLVMLAGLLSTGLAFGMAFINAAAPRFARLQVFLIEVPFLVAATFSNIPHMRWLLFQGPLWLAGTFMIIEKNYEATANLIHAQQRIAYLAHYDPLTGLANRAQIINKLAEACSHGAGKPRAYLLFLDLDGFKEVNDVFGHGAGDELLQSVAARLRSFVRPDDTVGRLGGDEFVVILNDLNFMQIQSIALRIVQVIAEPFDLASASNVRIGVSIGGTPLSMTRPGDALESADAMLYAAKHSGKGTVRLGAL